MAGASRTVIRTWSSAPSGPPAATSTPWRLRRSASWAPSIEWARSQRKLAWLGSASTGRSPSASNSRARSRDTASRRRVSSASPAWSAYSTAACVSAFTPSTGAIVPSRSASRAHGVAGAQAREPVGLRERADHQEPRERADEAQAGVDVLGVLEVHERLVEQHVHPLRQHRQQAPQLGGGQVVTGRVVGVADDDRARAVRHGAGQGGAVVGVVALGAHRDRSRAGARGHQRVERIRGPRHHQLVALGEQRQGRRLEQLRGAVAEHHLLGRHAVALGQQPAHAARVAVRIPVHAPARAGDGGVHDLRVRQVGPLGAGQVEVGHLLERQLALGGAPLAALAVQLQLVDVVELPVVAEEIHVATAEPGSAPAPGSGRTRCRTAPAPPRRWRRRCARARRAPAGARRRGARASRRGPRAWRRPS